MNLVTGPAVEPLSLADAKDHLRLETTADDTYVTGLISVGRRLCEQQIHQCFVSQTWDVYLDHVPGINSGSLAGYFGSGGSLAGNTVYNRALNESVLTLPHGPVQSVTYLKYYDSGGTQETWDSSNYVVSPGNPGRLAPKQNVYWPTVAAQIDAINVRYVAGYGDTADTVPALAIHAIKLVVANLYENRVPVVTGLSVSELPQSTADLLNAISTGVNLFA